MKQHTVSQAHHGSCSSTLSAARTMLSLDQHAFVTVVLDKSCEREEPIIRELLTMAGPQRFKIDYIRIKKP